MLSKIFVNYRRDDDPNGAARVRDGLAAKFGKANVFMDVDNLLAGQRFDEELAKALSQCDVLVAVIGPRWMELLRSRASSGERDYVREEIATALRPEVKVGSVRVGDQPPRPSRVVLRERLIVIPVRVGREGQLAPLPRAEDLPEDIRDLVLYQKHDVAHERFGRDIAELIEAIQTVRRSSRPQYAAPRVPWGWVGATAASVLAIGYAGAYYSGVPVPWPGTPPADTRTAAAASRSRADDEVKARAVEVERLRVAAAKAEQDRKRGDTENASRLAAEQKGRIEAEARRKEIADAAEKARADQESREKAVRDEAARKKAEDDARARATAEAEAKRTEDEAERQRMAALKAEEDRLLIEGKPKRGDPALSVKAGSGRSFRDCADGCPDMVVVPAGSFTMGSSASEIAVLTEEHPGGQESEGPRRTVVIRQPFAVGKFEVTFDEWEACVAGGGCTSNRNPGDQGLGRGRRPVINVSWDDAKEYVSWLSNKTGKSYRLLTEAEWEYAARAGTRTAYHWGNSFVGGKANDNGQAKLVGQYPANAFGLHDMHGNVWEWVEDCWHGNYNGAPSDERARTTGCSDARRRVLRGGSWESYYQLLRSAYRYSFSSSYRNYDFGFRIGRTLTR